MKFSWLIGALAGLLHIKETIGAPSLSCRAKSRHLLMFLLTELTNNGNSERFLHFGRNDKDGQALACLLSR